MFRIRKDVMSYGYYYLCYNENDEAVFDYEVAKQLDISLNDFQAIMLKQFGAFVSNTMDRVYFKNGLDAQRAVEYINSFIR